MIQQSNESLVKVSYLHRQRSVDHKYKYPSIKKRRSNGIIHIALGLSTHGCSSDVNKTKFLTIQNSIKCEKKFIHSFCVTKVRRSLLQAKKKGTQTKQSLSQLDSSTKTQTDQNSDVNKSSKTESLLIQSSKVTPCENVSINHSGLDEKGMKEDYHRMHGKNKKTKCSRRCVILTCIAILLAILIVITVLLVLLIKPTSTITRIDVPILRWNLTGITVAGISNNSGNSNNQLKNPTDVRFDDENNLYIVDYGNHRIQKYLFGASTGLTVAGNGTYGSSQYQLFSPLRMIIDSNENIYVTDASNERIQYWSKGAVLGKTVAGTLGPAGNSSNLFNIPYGITFNPTSGTLYISDYNNHRVMSYPSGVNSGTLVFGGNGGGKNNTQLYYPTAVHFDSLSNSLVIVNYAAHNIVRYVLGENSWTLIAGDADGNLGATSAKLYYPVEVAFDPMGNMYVADRSNHRIQFFYAGQSNGTTIAGLTSVPGGNTTTLNQPWSLRLDSQLNLYVADFSNHRVQKFVRY